MPPITSDRFDAVLFDLDGVLTRTARVHAACWKRMFDDFLSGRADAVQEPVQPFDIATDYPRCVDGKPRYDGVRSFLESRGLRLPDGQPSDAVSRQTVCGLGNRKAAMFIEALAIEGVETYEGAIGLVRRLRELGVKTAVVSSSRNCDAILQAAGIGNLFDERVDGGLAAVLGLAGKPAPDTFLHAAAQLGVGPTRAVVIEDAIAGVQAGRAGRFGLVIGVDRTGHATDLERAGADLVVSDLSAALAGGQARRGEAKD